MTRYFYPFSPKNTLATHHLTHSIRIILFGIGVVPIISLANTPSSLDTLSSYYHAKPNEYARCHGVWIQPTSQALSKNLDEHSADSLEDKTFDTDNLHSAQNFYAQAEYGYWDNDDYAELSGDVVIEHNGQQISAQKAIIHPKRGEATTQGQVLFHHINTTDTTNLDDGKTTQNIGMIGIAEKLAYQNHGATAQADDVAFASTTLGAHGHAKTLQKFDNTHYQLDSVMFSTCPPTQRKWHLDAQKIDINTQTGRGIAKNSTLKMGGMSVLYLPYFNFPIDNRRSSGFLLPTIGLGANNSLELDTPYYINIAPNYDATLTPTLFTNKNPMITGEFRYLTNKLGAGTISASVLPNDRKYHNKDRSRVFFDHQWHSRALPHLSAYATYRYVSDEDYLSDFDTLGLQNNPLNLPRRIGASYYNANISADLRGETFQTLTGINNDGTPITDKDKPYSRLPQLSVQYTIPNFGDDNPLIISGIHNSAYFKKSIKDGSEAEKSGTRMYNEIWASYPFLKSWGYITPKLGIAHLYASYDEDSLNEQQLSKKEGTYSVFTPKLSIDTGMFFEKIGSPFGLYDDSLGGYQVLMPRLKYTYTPYKTQNNIPNFETTLLTNSYNRLLADSWLLGYDRIQDLHAITPAIEYRYIDSQGRTRIELGVAEQVLIDDTKVNLHNTQPFNKKNSGMAWQLSTQPKDTFWLEASGAFTENYDLSSIIAQLRYQPNDQSLFNVGVIERKEHQATNQLSLSAYTASAIFPINHRWRLLSQAQYDYKNRRLLDALVGVNYEDCCYGVSVYARRYRNDLTPNAPANNAIMAEIRLNGITGTGKLNRLLDDKVMGFDTVERSWQKAY